MDSLNLYATKEKWLKYYKAKKILSKLKMRKNERNSQ
jgi:hypothetical protein